MKFENDLGDGSDILINEGATQNKVAMRTQDTSWIIQILSSNLYSDPIGSFIREITSNGWDAHVEAGVSDPVIIELKRDAEGQAYCRISDSGVGLSKERFNDIYRNIGASTKRQTNDQIGGFGIGRFSALAYAESVLITSVHEGIKSMYVMYKEDLDINIDEIFSAPTTDANGVSVKVDVQESDIADFALAVHEQLMYFDNVYFDTTLNGKDPFNDVKLKKFENEKFTLATMFDDDDNLGSVKILLGKVSYPVVQGLHIPSIFSGLNIGINFDIGELQVTPNRESIRVNTEVLKVIQARVVSVVTALEDMVAEEMKKITPIPEAADEFFTLSVSHEFGELEIHEGNKLDLPWQKRQYTFQGETYTGAQVESMSRKLESNEQYDMNYAPATLYNCARYDISSNAIRYATVGFGSGYTFYEVLQKFWTAQNDYVFAEIKDCNTITKAYLRSEYPGRKAISRKMLNDAKLMYWDNRVIRNVFMEHIFSPAFLEGALGDIPVVTNESVPKSFIKEYKENRRKNSNRKVRDKRAITIYENVQNQAKYQETTVKAVSSTVEETMKIFSNNLIVYYNSSDDLTLREKHRKLAFFHLKHQFLFDEKIRFVEMANKTCEIFDEFDNVVNIKLFMKAPYASIRKLGTYNLIFRMTEKYFPKLDTFLDMENFEASKGFDILFPGVRELTKIMYNANAQRTPIADGARFQEKFKYDTELLDELTEICAHRDMFTEDLDLFKSCLPYLQYLAGIQVIKDESITEESLLGHFNTIVRNKYFRPTAEAIAHFRQEGDLNRQLLTNNLKQIENDFIELYQG